MSPRVPTGAGVGPVPAVVVALVAGALLSGCASSHAPAPAPVDLPSDAPPKAPPPSALSLRVFDCGTIEVADPAMFGFPEALEPERTDLFVPCYLVEHPLGRMLFDVGLPPSVAEAENGISEAGMAMTLDRTLVDMLRTEIGLRPRDIDLLAISHLHFDHAGQASSFPRSELLLQRAEAEAAFGNSPPPGVDPDLVATLGRMERREVSGDHDVFGDGTVVLLSTPGHTPGHQSLLLRLPETGNLILSGDLYHFPESREHGLVPPFNTDPAATRESIERIEELVAQTDAELWIEHDPALAETLRLAPFQYR